MQGSWVHFLVRELDPTCSMTVKMKLSENKSHSVMSDSCNPMDCSPPGSSVHGILQARILEWVAISFSRRSFQPKDRTQVSCVAGGFFAIWATQEAPTQPNKKINVKLTHLGHSTEQSCLVVEEKVEKFFYFFCPFLCFQLFMKTANRSYHVGALGLLGEDATSLKHSCVLLF